MPFEITLRRLMTMFRGYRTRVTMRLPQRSIAVISV